LKKIKAYFLLESLILAILYLCLIAGLLRCFFYQQNYLHHLENRQNNQLNLIGFEALFSRWISSYGVLACLYPLKKQGNDFLLHGETIWHLYPNRVEFYTGRLHLKNDLQALPKNAWMITQTQLKKTGQLISFPFWLFVYEKQVLKWTKNKIYLEHDGQTQMLVEGLEGLKISSDFDWVELSIEHPKFLKRYPLCQNFKKDLDWS